MDHDPNMLIFTYELHWKLILTSRIHFIQQLYFKFYNMPFSVLAEEDTVVTKASSHPLELLAEQTDQNKTE